MDQRIIDLKSTTFSGRRVNRQQIADIQETVALFPNDSRNELAKTICEHLGWRTAKGAYKVGACLGMLETLESHGILKLPPKREDSVRDMKAVDAPAWTSASDPQPEIAAPLADLRPLRVEPVTDTEGRQLWNAFVDRHHYLGYRRPFGAHVRYFVTDRDGRRLGCVLFEAATKTLPCRDRWIGWNARTRDRRRHLMVVNSRFLVFPWVVSRNLASSALAMATRRLADDWERLHGVRPVLCETFVDETRFRASCYRAANWERIGDTAGKGRSRKAKSRKGVYVMPLCKDPREILRGKRDAGKPKPPTRSERGRSAASERRFSKRVEALVAAATAVAAREDARWQKRRRVFDSLLIMLFVFRLVVAPRGQGYRTTLCELWEQCAAAGVALPQDEPPAASTACEAREKLDEAAFRRLHREVLAAGPECPPWKGRRILAVDGSKITLPRELAESGFRVSDGAHYPQGMVSVLYRLRDRIPVDFDLFDHENEREAALTHLDHAAEGDVIVYDRGYWSFAMALAHQDRGLDFVFRLKKAASPVFDDFTASGETERTVTLDAPRDETALRGRSLRVRLVKYVAGDTEFRLATSLHDGGRFDVQALSDMYHGRWGVEEMYKSGKSVIERFHAKSPRGVRQELYAALTLLALARQFSNRCDDDLNGGDGDGQPAMRANFRNGLRLVGREIEVLFMRQADTVRQSVARIMTGLSQCIQRERPGRSYPRRSMQSRRKWQIRQAA